MSNKDVNQLYLDVFHHMKSKRIKELDVTDKVAQNLLSAIYERMKYDELFCEDIMVGCANLFLQKDCEKEYIDDNRGEKLIQNINKELEKNKGDYYLLIPINGARLSKDILFKPFYFIVGDEKEKEKKIAKITGIDRFEIHHCIDHTKKSRSKGFMKHPLLVLKMNNVFANVRNNASVIAQRIFQIIKLMIYESEMDWSINEWATDLNEPNFHVAVIGEEDWTRTHGHWYDLIQCKYSLDFLSKKENQNEFVELAKRIIFEKNYDQLFDKFLNALELFEKSLEQYENFRNTTLSMIIMFSAAESLLVKNSFGQKLHLSVIWPRIVNVTDKEQKELSLLIKTTYEKRNCFVHTGDYINNSYEEETRILHQMLAKLIIFYLSSDVWKGESDCTGEDDITKWEKYVDGIFIDAIYS